MARPSGVSVEQPPTSATKHNKKEVEEWERLHRAYALGRGRSSRGAKEGDDAAMRDAFAALKRVAR